MKNQFLLIFFLFSCSIVLAQWEDISAPGGDVYCLEKNSTTLFGGTKSGIFRSTDHGQSWENVIGVQAKDIATAGNKIFATTSLPGYPNIGVSFDNGTTWYSTENGFPASNIYAGALHTVNNNLVLAGSEFGVYKTTDGGYTWSASNTGIPFSNLLGFIDFEKVGDTLFTAFYHVNGNNHDYYIYYSINNGQNWIQASTLNNPINVIDLQAFNNELYLSANDAIWKRIGNGYTSIFQPTGFCEDLGTDGTYLFAGSPYGVYRSSDAVNWDNQGIANGIRNGTNAGGFLQDGNTFYAGMYGGHSGLYRTTDAGQMWQMDINFGHDRLDIVHVTNTELYVYASEGLQRSSDNGLNYQTLYYNGNPIAPNTLQGGTPSIFQQIGDTIFLRMNNTSCLRSIDNGNTWNPITFPFGSMTWEIQMDTLTQTIYEINDNGSLHSSTDLGLTWTTSTFNPPVSGATNYNFRIINGDWFLDAYTTTPSAYTYGLFKSTDLGQNWTNLGFSGTGFYGSNPIFHQDSFLLYNGHSSIDGGQNWLQYSFIEADGETADNFNLYFETGGYLHVSNDGGASNVTSLTHLPGYTFQLAANDSFLFGSLSDYSPYLSDGFYRLRKTKIATVADQNICSSSDALTIPLSIVSATDTVEITATSSNQTFLPDNNIAGYSGVGPYSIAIDPITGQTGTVTITVTAICLGIKDVKTFTLNINNSDVQISSQPESSTICEGSPINISVNATGNITGYQWLLNNVPLVNNTDITGATSQNLVINNSIQNYSGEYRCIVSGSSCGLSSAIANITVTPSPQVTSEPSDLTVCENVIGQLDITASGSNLSYQWYKGLNALTNNSNISGVNTSTLSFVSVSLSDAGQYHCEISNGCGQPAVSTNADITVNTRPQLTTQPIDISECEHDTISFSVSANGTNLTYIWKKGTATINNSAHFGGATTNILTINNIGNSDIANYSCSISSSGCLSLSDTAQLAVNLNTTITSQPNDITTLIDSTAIFTVTATGTDLTYEWRKGIVILSNGNNISGVNTSILTITNLSLTDEGFYNCIVSGSCGNELSTDTALLDVSGTGINEVELNNILIYPNPTTGTITINGLTDKATATILDATGRVVLATEVINNKVDVSLLANGIYVLRIETVRGLSNFRIIKQ